MEIWVFLAKIKSPKNQLHNSILAPWQYWLGITKPKSAFSTILKASNKLLQILKKNYSMEFSTACRPACLMPSGKHNSITAKAMGLIFTVRLHFVPRRAFWHTAVRTMYASWTYLCPPLCSISFC